jgi:hypothetical protein
MGTHRKDHKEVLDNVQSRRMGVLAQNHAENQTDRFTVRSDDQTQHVIRPESPVFCASVPTDRRTGSL